MKPLTEDEVRKIIRDEMDKNYMAGSPDIPPHSHNGTDNLNISPADLIGFTALPITGQKYLNTVTGQYEFGFGAPSNLSGTGTSGGLIGSTPNGATPFPAQYIANKNISQYPIAIVVGNSGPAQISFNGGYAPEGTLVYFAGTANKGLYIRFDGDWVLI